ncbi:MAG: prepilin peptidase [candidate division WOR-3 bacterium]|nr:prepilin peptidase [candidate division WOR-3 bacterium]
MIWALAALLGLVFGSFFNVVIWRVPLHKSISSPPSHCPRCRKPIRPYDNIPVLSWLILRGRCRDCGKPISVRYPLIEALTGLLFVAAYARFGFSLLTVKVLVFISLLIITALIDLDHQIIPFGFSVTGLVLGLAGGLVAPPPELKGALAGAAVGAGFILFAWLLWRYVLAGVFRRFGVDQKEGMGFGDLPYAAMIGAFVGLKGLTVALAAAVVFGVVIGLIARSAGRNKRGQPIPFGPFLALGALAGLFFGPQLFDIYARFAGLA